MMRGDVRTPGLGDWGLLLLLSTMFGSSFLFFKVLDEASVQPFMLVLGRVGIAAAALLVFTLASGRRLPTQPLVWLELVGLGALNNVIPFTLIAFGESHVSSGLASVFMGVTPIFTLLLARLLLNEPLSAGKGAAIVLGFVGVGVLVGPRALHDLDVTSIGQLACLASSFVYGLGAIGSRRFARLGIAPIVTATGQLCGSTLCVLPLALIFDHPAQVPPVPATVWAAWLAMGLFSTALAYVVWFRLVRTIGATNTSLVTLLVPITGLLLGTLILGERVSASTFAGLAIIVAALIVIDGRAIRALTSRHVIQID